MVAPEWFLPTVPEGPRKVPAPTQGYSALVFGAALSQGVQP